MLDGVYRFLEVVSNLLNLPEPIVEIGPATRPEERFGRLVPARRHLTIDADPRVDASMAGDAAHLPLRDSSVGMIVICEVLEHVENPFSVAHEVIRVLAPRGICIATTPYDLPIHKFPRDFFRPSPDGLDYLFHSMPKRISGYQGKPEFPRTAFVVGFMDKDVDVNLECARLNDVLRARAPENRWAWLRGIPHFRHNPYFRALTFSNEYHFEPRGSGPA